ncbi:hypothetical protein F0562_033869 [Nyssa sinensis]|uniref:Uncharacterized protein n=1 Tax=Nyssa sinensis TaxID=561372 RepID=A0A5J5AHI4_9ASTE|nr:hypothetical protein F0562_033869 [Nyssa sinensis]
MATLQPRMAASPSRPQARAELFSLRRAFLCSVMFCSVFIAIFSMVVYRLHKDYVYETLREYGVQYGNIWIYDNIPHEITRFCSVHSLQQVLDMFDQARN